VKDVGYTRKSIHLLYPTMITPSCRSSCEGIYGKRTLNSEDGLWENHLGRE
jgi:hypothetical protein